MEVSIQDELNKLVHGEGHHNRSGSSNRNGNGGGSGGGGLSSQDDLIRDDSESNHDMNDGEMNDMGLADILSEL